ncbi:MAG: hypothetical protein KME27_28725 [Lyngbya sp. HA4199-MV5]|nr:hypothetical protein [Lyngbya sp. HA4199-MV5]
MRWDQVDEGRGQEAEGRRQEAEGRGSRGGSKGGKGAKGAGEQRGQMILHPTAKRKQATSLSFPTPYTPHPTPHPPTAKVVPQLIENYYS